MILLTLLFATSFVVATVAYGFGFSAIFVSFLMGLCLATISYAFLGGVEGAVFEAGRLRLAGAAAVVLVTVVALNGPLAREMADVKAIAAGREAEARIAAEQRKAADERAGRLVAERRAIELEGQAADGETNSVAGTIARLRRSTADQPLGRGVLELFRSGAGPFNRALGTVRLPVRFNEQVRAGTFQYCHSRRPEFHDRPVRFDLVDAQNATSTFIVLEPGNDIGAGLCTDIDSDVRLGCDAVTTLLPNMVAGCDGRAGVAWLPPNTNRKYDVVATILNPALVTRDAIGAPASRPDP